MGINIQEKEFWVKLVIYKDVQYHFVLISSKSVRRTGERAGHKVCIAQF